MRSINIFVFVMFFFGISFLLPQKASAGEKTIYVAPFAPLYHQVPLELGVRTADLVRKELEAQGNLKPVEGPTVTVAEESEAELSTPQSRAQALRRAENLLSQAREQAVANRFDQASQLFKSALEVYNDNLVHVSEFSTLIDIHLDIAAALFRGGREEEADNYMNNVIRLNYDRKLNESAYPSEFIERFRMLRDRAARAARGGITVMTSPPGADVKLNGRKMGKTPLHMKDMITGRHYLRVEITGVEPILTAVDVSPGEPERIELAFGGLLEGPVADVISGLSGNRFDDSVARQARVVANEIGADYVLLGVLQRLPRTYLIRNYLMRVDNWHVSRLSDLRIDLDYLGAAIEIFRLAEEVADFSENPPPSLNIPFTVFDGASQVAITFTEMVAGPPVPKVEEPVVRRVDTRPPIPRGMEVVEPDTSEPVAVVRPADETKPEPVRPVTPVEPAREPEIPVPSVEPEMLDEPKPAEIADESLRPSEPIQPVGPVMPHDAPEETGPVRDGPIGSGAITAPVEDEPAEDERRPFVPVAPVTETKPEEVEVIEDEDTRVVMQVGGARGRLLDSDLHSGTQRFAAVDIDEVVIIEDEDDGRRRRDGWPWWMWGLAGAGVIGLGAGGWFAVNELGGGYSNATITVEW